MTSLRLREDLTNKCSRFYFTKILTSTEKVVYKRRSFANLFNYYRVRGVTELQLMKALIQEGFYAQICGVEKHTKIMFAKVNAEPKGIWATPVPKGYLKNIKIHDKYTVSYIEDLYQKAKKELEND